MDQNAVEMRLSHIFTYHPPSPEDAEKYLKIREAAHFFAGVVLRVTPDGPDQSVALRKIREAVMTANAGIALNGIC